MCMNDIKLFAKMKKKKIDTLIQTIRIYSRDTGMEYDRKMCHAYNEKWEKRYNRSNRMRRLGEGKKLQILENLGSGLHQTRGDKRKNVLKLSTTVEISSKE